MSRAEPRLILLERFSNYFRLGLWGSYIFWEIADERIAHFID